MARFRIDLRAGAFRSVLGFTLEPLAASAVAAFAHHGRLPAVDAGRRADAALFRPAGRRRRQRRRADEVAWNAAMAAFSMLVALALAGVVLRHLAFMAIVELTLKMMADIAADAFHRVQRFSTDWHANSFAGSTVRKVTRGMWALDLLNDTILDRAVAVHRHAGRLDAAARLVLADDGARSSPSARSVSSRPDGGAVARLCRAGGRPCQWLGHQARRRAGRRGELQRRGQGLRRRSARGRAPRQGRRQMARPHAPDLGARHDQRHDAGRDCCWCCAPPIIGLALLLWSGGQASAGDITFVLTSFFVLQGYLRDVGMHIRNLQRSVNDMEELVDIQAEPLGIEDRADAEPIRIGEGGITLRRRDVPLWQPSDCRSIATSR